MILLFDFSSDYSVQLKSASGFSSYASAPGAFIFINSLIFFKFGK